MHKKISLLLFLIACSGCAAPKNYTEDFRSCVNQKGGVVILNTAEAKEYIKLFPQIFPEFSSSDTRVKAYQRCDFSEDEKLVYYSFWKGLCHQFLVVFDKENNALHSAKFEIPTGQECAVYNPIAVSEGRALFFVHQFSGGPYGKHFTYYEYHMLNLLDFSVNKIWSKTVETQPDVVSKGWLVTSDIPTEFKNYIESSVEYSNNN